MKNRLMVRLTALVISAVWVSSALAGWTHGGDAGYHWDQLLALVQNLVR